MQQFDILLYINYMLCYAVIDKICQNYKNLKVNNKVAIKVQIGL